MLVVIVVLWLTLVALSLVLMNVGGTVPGSGRGERIEAPLR